MREAFFDLAHTLQHGLHADEMLLSTLEAERSDFVRFNRGLVRQPGSVEQRYLTLRLVRDRRQASATLALAGRDEDLGRARAAIAHLREALGPLPEDPWLLLPDKPQSTLTERHGALPSAEAVVQQVVAHSNGCDLAGIYAAGTIYRGFANSHGQRNWHEVDSFNLDWSVHLEADRAVKESHAGFHWEGSAFEDKLETAKRQLAHVAAPRRTLVPGEYRAYLAPRALEEIVGLLSWGGFSARARATRQSPLLRMAHGATLAASVTMTENTAEGLAPQFQEDGYVRPARVMLVDRGRLGDALVSPRSAKEYGLAVNGAHGGESPESLEVAAGDLPEKDALAALDTGLYIGNLWYLNYSDRPAGRVTGMTRFATFWVEGGRVAAPVTPMRFDDSIYRMLGENLLALTQERALLLDPSTYDARSTRSARVPGALLGSLSFTL